MQHAYEEAMIHESILALAGGRVDKAWQLYQEAAAVTDLSQGLPSVADTVAEATGLDRHRLCDAWYQVRAAFEAYPFPFTVVKRGEPLFPGRVEGINLIYIYGDVSILSHPRVSLLGMKGPDEDGRNMAVEAVREAEEAGLAIMGTLDTGLDAYTMLYAYNRKVFQVAVLASPLHQCMPESQKELMVDIANSQRGLLVTPFSPCQKAQKWFTMPRNQLLCAMTDFLFILQEREGGPLWRLGGQVLDAGGTVMLPSSLTKDSGSAQARAFKERPGVVTYTRRGDLRKRFTTPHRRPKADDGQLELF